MSRRERASFSTRGEVYLLVAAWAAPLRPPDGYEPVEAELAGRVLGSLPVAVRRSVSVRGVLASASPASASSKAGLGRGPRGLVLYRRARVPAQATAPAPELIDDTPLWEPEPPPLLETPTTLTAQAAIAATLVAAAVNGAPFCEKCECQT